jgi:hypothetical protein
LSRWFPHPLFCCCYMFPSSFTMLPPFFPSSFFQLSRAILNPPSLPLPSRPSFLLYHCAMLPRVSYTVPAACESPTRIHPLFASVRTRIVPSFDLLPSGGTQTSTHLFRPLLPQHTSSFLPMWFVLGSLLPFLPCFELKPLTLTLAPFYPLLFSFRISHFLFYLPHLSFPSLPSP